MRKMIKTPTVQRTGASSIDEIDRVLAKVSPPAAEAPTHQLTSVFPKPPAESEATILRRQIDELLKKQAELTAPKATASVAAKQVPFTPGEYNPALDKQLDQVEVPGTTLVATVYSYGGGPAKVQIVRRFQGKWSKLGRIHAKELDSLVQVLREIERVHNRPDEMGGQP